MSSNDTVPTHKLLDYCDKIGIVEIKHLSKPDEYVLDKEPTKNTIFIQYEFSGQQQPQNQSFTESLMTIPKYKPHSPSGFYWYLELNPEKVIAQWVHHYLTQEILSDKSYFHRFLTPQNIIDENTICNKCYTEVKFSLPLSYNKSRFPLGYFLRGIPRNTPELSTSLPIFPQSTSRKNLKKNDLIYHSKLYPKQNNYYIQKCPTCNEIVLNSGYDYDKNAEEIAKLSFAMNVVTFHDNKLKISMKSYKKLSKINFPPNTIPHTTSVFPYSSLSDIQIPIKSLDSQKTDLDEQEKGIINMIKNQEILKTRFSKPTVKTSILKIINTQESKTHEKKSTLFVGTDPERPFYNERFNRKESSFIDKAISTISAFANTMGGTLIIGVNEKNNNEIIGIEKDIEFADNIKNLDDWKQQFIDLLDGINPVEYKNIILQNYQFHTINKKTILEIECPLHDEHIDIVSYTGGKKAHSEYKQKRHYQRKGPTSTRMSDDDLIAHMKRKTKN